MVVNVNVVAVELRLLKVVLDPFCDALDGLPIDQQCFQLLVRGYEIGILIGFDLL